jgi:predicted dehydrogenase
VLDIQRAQANSGAMVAVCHSLRYQPGFNLVKQLVSSGRWGEVRTVDLIEQVGYWHFAHSYIRGNWGNSGRATPLLLAKSCHDLDYLGWLLDVPCEAVASFGQLSHFHASRAPEGAPARCLDGCPVEHRCPYSAVRQYVQTDRTVWPASVISYEHTQQAHLEALRTGPYGLCVYRADNDVVDHQTVMLEYAQGQTATFTVTGFTQSGGRRLRVHGTEADLTFDEQVVTLRHYASGRTEEMRAGGEGPHGGGDLRVVRHWLEAVRHNDATWLLTDLASSLASHAVGFAAEWARRDKRLVRVAEIAGLK